MVDRIIARLKALQQETALEMLLNPNTGPDTAFAFGRAVGTVNGLDLALQAIDAALADEDEKERAA